MSITAFRLERFDRDEEKAARFSGSADALEDAFQRGYQQGKAAAETEQLGQLTTALLDCAERLADERIIRAAARNDVARSIGQLLDAVLDTIGPIGQRDQLKVFLADQLERLSSHTDQGHCLIRCNAEMAPHVRQILQQLGLNGIQVEILKNSTAPTEVLLGGGATVFDPAEIIATIRHLSHNLILETQA